MPGESLQTVAYLVNGTAAGSSSTPPFVFRWNNVSPGTYSLTAVGHTVGNAVFTSPPITCLVYSEAHYPQPKVFSGPDSDSSYVINGVGALFLFGKRHDQFGRTVASELATPFLALKPDGVGSWNDISATWTDSWALNDSGRLFRNGKDAVLFPAGVTFWKHVSGGGSGAVMVGSNGELYLDGTTHIAVPRPAGGWRDAKASLNDQTFNLILGLGENGEVYKLQHHVEVWSSLPIPKPSGVSRWKAIAQAAAFGLLQTDADELWINEFYGRIDGNPSTPEFRQVPRPLGVNRWLAVSAGGFHALAIGDDRQLYAWGRNWEHQLGAATDQNPRLAPTKVDLPPGVHGWSYAAAGRFHSLAIADDCSLYGWGANDYGQLGQPESSPIARPVRIGSLEALCGRPVIFTEGTASQLPDGSFQLRFNSDLNRAYLVQYSDDLNLWKTSVAPVLGTGDLVEWVDIGPPKTDQHPAMVSHRSYRVIFAP